MNRIMAGIIYNEIKDMCILAFGFVSPRARKREGFINAKITKL